MTDERSTSDSISPSLDRLLARWAEDQIYVIHKLTKEIGVHISEPGDETWHKRVEEGQTRLLEELDQLVRELIGAESDEQAGKMLAALWADERRRIQIEDYLRRRTTDADRAFDGELCESWERAEESRMDKGIETLRKENERNRAAREAEKSSGDKREKGP